MVQKTIFIILRLSTFERLNTLKLPILWTITHSQGLKPGWVTNITSDKIDAAIVSDMFPLNEQYNNTEITFSPTNRHSNNGFLCNLGNWGFVYKEAIHIQNNTDKNRIVRYYLGTVVSDKEA